MTNLKPSFTVYDPTTPPPPLPPSEVERLTTKYAARPARPQPPPRYVWIVTYRPDDDTLARARAAVFGAWHTVATNWTVMVCRGDPARLIIAETCEAYDIALLVTSYGKALDMASKIVSFGHSGVLREAIRRRIPIRHNRRVIELPPVQMVLPLAA